MTNRLSSLHIYPLKSAQGISVSSSYAYPSGLSFDRRLMLVDSQGDALTSREYPRLLGFSVIPSVEGFILIAPNGAELSLNIQGFPDQYQPVQLWGKEVSAQYCGQQAEIWLYEQLGRPCRLVYFGDQSSRFTSRKPEMPVAFADGYPFLLCGTASLEWLNQQSSITTEMQQFRANLVIETKQPFIEDQWRKIRIGKAEFELLKPCARCVMTRWTDKGERQLPEEQPLATLRRFRQDTQGELLFGQNMVALNSGLLETGMKVEILARQPQPSYLEQRAATLPDENYVFSLLGKEKRYTFSGRQTILSQALEQGVELPHHCQAGHCGRCKCTLVDGTVEQHPAKALTKEEQERGKILTCCAFPTSNINLSID